MKKHLLTAFALGLSLTAALAQGFFDQVGYQGAFPTSGTATTINLYGQTVMTTTNGDWTKGWTNWDPQNTIYPGDGNAATLLAGNSSLKTVAGINYSATVRNVSGDISTNTTWGKDDGSEYILMSGAIHVLNGATLTIKPGTVIRGDVSNISFLLIAKGGKLNAIGTSTQPIVFTSNKAPGSRTSGDWAGFLLMGKSQTNTGVRRFEALPSDPLSEYGGGANADINDNSGEMRFLRVEFAGYNYLPDQEINGVTFGAVGRQTRFDFCQVSFSRDDSYEWFGGTSNHKYLIAWAGIDDEFDMDEGYQGKCQFLLGVRKHDVFETSAGGSSHGFEHDNNTGWGTSAQNVVGVNNPQPSTRPIISNATLIGPRIGNIPGITGNRFNAGMAFRTGDESCVYNTIVTGYPRQFQLFHNSAALTPSAHQKLMGVSDVANYTKNEVLNTVLFTDLGDNNSSTNPLRTGRGQNSGIIESQAQPAIATFDPSTGNFLSGGTLMDNAGISTFFNISSFGNGRSTSTDVLASVFTGGSYYTGTTNSNGSPVINTPDFTLKSNAPILTTTGFTASNLASNLATGFYFNAGPSIITISAAKGVASLPVQVNISAFGLTGTGIALNLSATNFQISTDNGTTWATTASALSNTASSVWVRYNAAAVGTNNGTLTLTPADARVSAATVSLTGFATEPLGPFVGASAFQLPNLSASALNALSSASVFTITGGLLTSNITVTAPSNFLVSKDGSNYSSFILYTTTGTLAQSVVYVKYAPVTANNAITVGGVAVNGSDNGTVSIATASAVTELVIVNGTWGFTSQVGPKAADGSIIQNFVVPSFPNFTSYYGVPSTSRVTYIAAQNIPSGQTLIVNALAGLEYSYDNASFSAASLTFAGINGNVPVTPFFVRYNGVRVNSSNTAAFGNYGVSGGSVIAVGLSGGASTLDKFIGLQGASVISPTNNSATVPASVGGTVTTTGLDNIITFTTSITGRVIPGVGLYTGSISGFLGFVTTVIDAFNVGLSKTVVGMNGSVIYATPNNTGAINVQSDFFESNKDYNRGALIFPSGNLSSSTTFDVNSQNAAALTLSGWSALSSVFVGRDVTTEYALRYEVSLDNGTTWVTSTTLGLTNGFLAPTKVLVRYNPTGSNLSGLVNLVPTTVAGFGQHTGAIAVGGSNGANGGNGTPVYTIGYSDPIMYASSSVLPTTPAPTDVIVSVNNLKSFSNFVSMAVPISVYGKRLQSDITVTPSDAAFLVSKDGVTFSSSSLTLSKDASSNYNGTVFVRFEGRNAQTSKMSTINFSSTKVSQSVLVNGVFIPTTTTGVHDGFIGEEATTSVTIYPNPTSGNFSIDLEGVDVAEVAVYSTFGQLVYTSSIATGVNEIKTSLNKGLYIVKISSNGKFVAKKLIVQ